MRVAVLPTAVVSADSGKTSRGRLDPVGAGGWNRWSRRTTGCRQHRPQPPRSRGYSVRFCDLCVGA